MGSLLSEDLLATPGPAALAAQASAAADPEHRPLHLVDLAHASLLAGEPRRALRMIDEIADGPGAEELERHLAALRSWAVQLDRNCYPGNLGAEVAFPAATVHPAPGPPETEFVERIVAGGPPALFTPRALIAGLQRQAKAIAVQQMAQSTIANLQALVEYARQSGGPHLGHWAYLAQIDIAQRTGNDQVARQSLTELRGTAERAGLTGILVLSRLIEGDWSATPETSPEALGFDLAPQPNPAPIAGPADLARAATCLQEAERLAVAVGAPRIAPALWAGVHLRWATLAWQRHDHVGRRQHLDIAVDAARTAGAAGLVRLLEVHLLIADLAEGRLGDCLLEIGTGWGEPPSDGRPASIRRWAETDGSISWCIGLGRLLERAGDGWKQDGEVERASLAYLAAAHLLAIEPRLPSRTVHTAVADLDTHRNLTGRALVRLERLLTSAPPITELPAQMFDFTEELEILVSIVRAQQTRQRGPAAEHVARGLLRIKARIEGMVAAAQAAGIVPRVRGTYSADTADLRGLFESDKNADLDALLVSAGQDRASQAMLAMLVGQAQEQLKLIDVLVPLSRAGDALRRGRTEAADQFHDAALDAAENGAAYLYPLVLIAADRRDEARGVIAEFGRVGVLDDDLLSLLAAQAGDLDTARAALKRTGADPLTTSDWHVALNGAEIAIEEPTLSLAAAEHGIALFEDSIGRLIRDTDRVEAGDDPAAASLYLTATKACLALARQEPTARAVHQARAFEFTERARSLAIDQVLPAADQQPAATTGAEHRWRELAANWAADVDRLLAGIDAVKPTGTPHLLARADASERALRDMEVEQERATPGILVRRSRPRVPLRLRAVQEQLSPGTALLEYHTVGDDLIVAAVTRDKLSIQRREVRSRQLAALVLRHHERCAAGSGAGQDADRLAELLLDPVAEIVRDQRRVIVVPFGPLTLVPVHALPFQGGPLGLTHVLSYAPAAAVGATTDRLVRTGRAAIVGDPAFDPELHPRLRRLPGAHTEAAVIAGILGSPDVLTDVDATEEAVRALLPGRGVIHLATHGWLDQLAPYASSVVLAGQGELTVAELVGMELGSDLAVLSACDTGRGAATLGGDVVGLTRALLASGVRGAVVSLWPVDDMTACVTMAAFYQRLSTLPPAAALAQAQREVYWMDRTSLRGRYTELVDAVDSRLVPLLGAGAPAMLSDPAGSAPPDAVVPHRRRGELDDDEPLPDELGGSAELHWAPFVLVGAS